MTVNELIDALKKMPDSDAPVMLSRDAEGNGYSSAVDVELTCLDSHGEPCHPDDAPPDPDDANKVVVLWPS